MSLQNYIWYIRVELFSMLSELIGNFMKKGEYLRHTRVFSSVRFPRGYSCVALYQEVVPFSKAMGLVLGSEIVIPEKVCMGRDPLALE